MIQYRSQCGLIQLSLLYAVLVYGRVSNKTCYRTNCLEPLVVANTAGPCANNAVPLLLSCSFTGYYPLLATLYACVPTL